MTGEINATYVDKTIKNRYQLQHQLGKHGLWTNKVSIGMVCFLPSVGWIMTILLGAKGNEWAWKSRKWRSIEHFKEHQRGWAIALIGSWL